METSRKRGRPRGFDRQKALETALELFWRQGYEGTSIADLTQAMGITPPSLYSAFGAKERLYREVLDLYAATRGAYAACALAEEPTARAGIERMLREAADVYAARGCMLTGGALACAPENAAVSADLARRRGAGKAAITARLERAVAAGELPAGTDTAGLGAYYAAIVQGLSVQARDATSRADLDAIAALAMAAWPAGMGHQATPPSPPAGRIPSRR